MMKEIIRNHIWHDILTRNNKVYISIQKTDIDEIFTQIKEELLGKLPKKDSYAMGLASKIGKLLGQPTILKQVEKDRNIGFNDCLSQIQKIVEEV